MPSGSVSLETDLDGNHVEVASESEGAAHVDWETKHQVGKIP